MKMGNVAKWKTTRLKIRKQPNPSIGLQNSRKIPQPESCFNWPLINNMYYFSDNGRHTNKGLTLWTDTIMWLD